MLAKFLLRAAFAAVGLWAASRLVHGIRVDSLQTLAIAALLLGVVNAFVRPVVFILTLPLTVVTLGLFLLVVNAMMIGLVAVALPGFKVSMACVTTPTLIVRPPARPRAIGFGTKPRRAMARSMALRLSWLTAAVPLRMRDTVLGETPAALATISSVTLGLSCDRVARGTRFASDLIFMPTPAVRTAV